MAEQQPAPGRDSGGGNPARRSGLIWGIVDGSVSISLSMLLAVTLNHCPSCGGWWGVGFLSDLTRQDSGLIAVATLLLFPCAVIVFGGIKMFFLLKQEYDERRRARRQEMREWFAEDAKEALTVAFEKGQEHGRKAERDRISDSVEELGVQLPPEIDRIISGESEPEFQLRQQIRREERERIRRALAQQGSLSNEEIARLLPD